MSNDNPQHTIASLREELLKAKRASEELSAQLLQSERRAEQYRADLAKLCAEVREWLDDANTPRGTIDRIHKVWLEAIVMAYEVEDPSASHPIKNPQQGEP